jgi:hypothetical protein
LKFQRGCSALEQSDLIYFFSGANNRLPVGRYGQGTPPDPIFWNIIISFIAFNNAYSEITIYHFIYSDVNIIGANNIYFILLYSVPWLRRLFAGLTPRRPRFKTVSVHMEFVVDKMSLG